MGTYKVEALEKFVVRTTYYVKAETAEEAERRCKAGEEAYEDMRIEEGDEEWLATLNVEAVLPIPKSIIRKANRNRREGEPG